MSKSPASTQIASGCVQIIPYAVVLVVSCGVCVVLMASPLQTEVQLQLARALVMDQSQINLPMCLLITMLIYQIRILQQVSLLCSILNSVPA